MTELVGRKDALLKDRDLAFPFILSSDTKRVDETRWQLLFLQNQVLDECRRIGKTNGAQLIDHWLKYATIGEEYCEKQRSDWREFIDEFSATTSAEGRKMSGSESDQEQTGIEVEPQTKEMSQSARSQAQKVNFAENQEPRSILKKQ